MTRFSNVRGRFLAGFFSLLVVFAVLATLPSCSNDKMKKDKMMNDHM